MNRLWKFGGCWHKFRPSPDVPIYSTSINNVECNISSFKDFVDGTIESILHYPLAVKFGEFVIV